MISITFAQKIKQRVVTVIKTAFHALGVLVIMLSLACLLLVLGAVLDKDQDPKCTMPAVIDWRNHS